MSMDKNTWKAIGAALLVLLAIIAIWEFFRNDRNQLVTARGKQVLNDDKLMKRVKREMEKHEQEGISGPVVVNLS